MPDRREFTVLEKGNEILTLIYEVGATLCSQVTVVSKYIGPGQLSKLRKVLAVLLCWDCGSM